VSIGSTPEVQSVDEGLELLDESGFDFLFSSRKKPALYFGKNP